MPFLENLGASVYWDEQGSGAPFLLISGLAWSSNFWHRIRPLLRGRYRTIAFDNRGTGQSSAIAPYSIPQMAADAAAVLNAARVNTAHIFGLGMGGMIAQELALQYPKKVRSLILGGTSPGGPAVVSPEPDVITALKSVEHSDQFLSALNALSHAEGTPPQRVQEDLEMAKKAAASSDVCAAQLRAIETWDAGSRLQELNVPTLVIHGAKDRIFPAKNAQLLAAKIPGAKLKLIARAGYLFLTDQPEASQAALLEFLTAQATRKSERATPVLER
jgi:3-oxoadipate enol-lactonase